MINDDTNIANSIIYWIYFNYEYDKKECRCRFLVNKRFNKHILDIQVIKPLITYSTLHPCLTEIHLLHLSLETLKNKAITGEGECAFKV